MPENRYHTLLKIDEELTNPDYFQLLEIREDEPDAKVIESQYRAKMSMLQHQHSTKHKEFIEFLKGELKRARRTLTDEHSRDRYLEELQQERIVQIKKSMRHLLLKGKLTRLEEMSLLMEGRRLGLTEAAVKQAIDEELRRTGVRNVTGESGGSGQASINVGRPLPRPGSQPLPPRPRVVKPPPPQAQAAAPDQKEAEESPAPKRGRTRRALGRLLGRGRRRRRKTGRGQPQPPGKAEGGKPSPPGKPTGKGDAPADREDPDGGPAATAGPAEPAVAEAIPEEAAAPAPEPGSGKETPRQAPKTAPKPARADAGDKEPKEPKEPSRRPRLGLRRSGGSRLVPFLLGTGLTLLAAFFFMAHNPRTGWFLSSLGYLRQALIYDKLQLGLPWLILLGLGAAGGVTGMYLSWGRKKFFAFGLFFYLFLGVTLFSLVFILGRMAVPAL